MIIDYITVSTQLQSMDNRKHKLLDDIMGTDVISSPDLQQESQVL